MKENNAILRIQDAYEPIMPLLESLKFLHHGASSIKENSSQINAKRHIDDVDRNSSSNYNKKNSGIQRKRGEDGDKRQRIAPLVLDREEVLKGPNLLENVEDGELSD